MERRNRFHRLAEQLGGRRVQPAKALYTRLIQLGIAVEGKPRVTHGLPPARFKHAGTEHPHCFPP